MKTLNFHSIQDNKIRIWHIRNYHPHRAVKDRLIPFQQPKEQNEIHTPKKLYFDPIQNTTIESSAATKITHNWQ